MQTLQSFLDRLTAARQRLEGSKRLPAAFTIATALFVLGGFSQLAVDDTPVEVAMPEPPLPTMQEAAPAPADADVGALVDSAKLATAAMLVDVGR